MSLRQRLLPRLFRLGLLAAASALVYAASLRPKLPDLISLADAQTFFPDAAQLTAGDPRLGGQTVVGRRGEALGLVLTTSPHTDDLIGYSGPSNLLIALDARHRVIGVRLLASGDTLAHVDEVRRSEPFWKQFTGLERTTAGTQIKGVSGSTLTSLAMAEAIERRLGGTVASLRFPEPVTLAEVQSLFPQAASFKADDPRAGWHLALDKNRVTLGYAVRTSPFTDNGRGYRGPTESLVAIAADGRTVNGLVIRRSYDTPDYVARVRDDEEFLKSLTGRTMEDWARLDFAREGIEGVSGATQTSYAVADGLKRRFAADVAAAGATKSSPPLNPGLLAVIGGGLAMTFTRLRTSRRLRMIWQAVLVVVFLVWLGDLVSLALLAGWARHGVPWRTAPSVVLLVAVALLVPWATRRQIYCQQLCPHGAAQSWLGHFKRLHVRLPPNVHRWLMRLPAVLLAAGLVLALFWPSFDLARIEPFDGWVLKSAAAVSLAIAVVGLIASLFVPQAYCRYGCPTGELLRLVKSGGGYDRIGWRDWTAGGLVAACAAAVFAPNLLRARLTVEPGKVAESDVTELSGRAFGTTWSVKLHGQHNTAALNAAVAAELERIESTLSHWRPDSLTSQFNASETMLATEQPAELIALVARAQELSRLTDGAYDITVAPLVDAWGFGPSGTKAAPPSDDEVAQLLQRTGWQKLIVDRGENTLEKKHPQLQIDLGSLLQGYAADQVAQVLSQAGVSEFLIEVGGELLARGTWQVAIEDPANPAHPLRKLSLTNSALATSGVYRAMQQGGSPTHHLISPQTGRPIAATATLAAVMAPTAVEADAWATALLAVGLPDALRLADQQGLAAVLLDLNHQQQLSARAHAAFAEKQPAISSRRPN